MNTQPETPTPAGLLLIDKEIGYTSMDVCAIVRGRLRHGGAPKRIKVGHAGTLDPMATGLLVVLIGKGTRLCERFMASIKTYETTIDLSHFSTTDDAEGVLTPVTVTDIPSREMIQAIISQRFIGTVMQRPPDYSAISVGGKRAYDRAREGKPIQLAERPVRIDAFTVTAYQWPFVRAEITCGKGTYIRSLARDLGLALDTGGMLTQLRRTRSGEHDVSLAVQIGLVPDPLLQQHLMPLPENPANLPQDSTEDPDT